MTDLYYAGFRPAEISVFEHGMSRVLTNLERAAGLEKEKRK